MKKRIKMAIVLSKVKKLAKTGELTKLQFSKALEVAEKARKSKDAYIRSMAADLVAYLLLAEKGLK